MPIIITTINKDLVSLLPTKTTNVYENLNLFQNFPYAYHRVFEYNKSLGNHIETIKHLLTFLLKMDMQELIEEQMRSKMINNRKVQTAEPQQTSAAANLAKRWSNYKLWGLFQR